MSLRQLRAVGERVPAPSLRILLRSWPKQSLTAVLLADVAASLMESDDRARRFNFQWLDSATAALAVVLRAAVAAKRVARPEVIIPAFACPDIVAAAVHAGVRPVLADLLPDSAQLDPLDVVATSTARTVAVVSVRLLGLPGNVSSIRRAFGSDCPTLIEDCAHVLPRAVFESEADAMVLSFGRGKPVSLRRGGLLLTARDAELDVHGAAPQASRTQRAAALRHWLRVAFYNHAIAPRAYWFLTRVCGFRVDAIKYRSLRKVQGFPDDLAGFLPLALSRDFSGMAQIATAYARMLRSICGPWIDIASPLSCHGGWHPPLWRYPLLLATHEQRDNLFGQLWRRGLGPSRMYRQTLSDLAETSPHVTSRTHPNARSFAGRLLTLPLHSDVTSTDVADIEECFLGFAGAASRDVTDTQLLVRSS